MWVTVRAHGRSVVAIIGVLVAVFGAVSLITRPWARLPALVVLLVGGSAVAGACSKGATRAKIIAVSLSTLVGLYGWELYLALGPGRAQRALSAEHDRRTKREVVLDLRRRGDATAVPIVYPSALLYFPHEIPAPTREIIATQLLPFGGLSGRTTVLCNEGGTYAIYTADKHGFRNPSGAVPSW